MKKTIIHILQRSRIVGGLYRLRKLVAVCVILLMHTSLLAGPWPYQKAPAYVVQCEVSAKDPTDMFLAQSVSGLAAQALNTGHINEGVWINNNNEIYARYFEALCKRFYLKKQGSYTTWELVKKYKEKGIVKGYVLYDINRKDASVNIATIEAGLKQAVLIDVSQEAIAKQMGLEQLFDAVQSKWDLSFFNDIKNKVHPRLLVIENPASPNNRDYAIAHRSMVYYGVDSLLDTILKRMPPLSTIIGWNKGDEFKHIAPCTRWGHVNTVSDFCLNLPMLSITSKTRLPKMKSIDPNKIEWKDGSNFHAFVMSDGDNMQWTMNQFIRSKDYWASPYNEELHMGFTTCIANLALGARDVFGLLQKTQPPSSSVVEYGGGYYYPDLFGVMRTNRKALLRQLAADINRQMKQTGVKVLGFICKDVNSAAAKEAYQVFSEEIDDLTGIIAVQYSPYNGGQGALLWVRSRKGIDIPVLTAKYQLWANMKKTGSGTPPEIATFINKDAAQSAETYSWTIVHAWSRFDRLADGSITDLNKGTRKGARGVTPVKWTKDLLDPSISVVSIEEVLWRIRMKHYPQQTKFLIKKYNR